MSDTRQPGIPAVTFTQGHGLDGPWGMVAGETQHSQSLLIQKLYRGYYTVA